ncbi:MAG: type II secretion system secretin GspD [Succinivibrionaceae bacterium]
MQTAFAEEFSASFKGTDIQEFISTVGKNLNKSFIIDPAVRGKINVRSYDLLNEDQYYQFFLSVLEVYGYAVVPLDNNTYKVVRSAIAKTSGVPVSDGEANGDEMITRVIPVHNVNVRELSPLLRSLIDNQGAGNVVHYEPSNVILITGRARVVNRLVEIINRVDKAGNQDVEIYHLNFASATEVVRVVNTIIKGDKSNNTSALLIPKIVADERTNSVVISGEPKARVRVIDLVKKLDMEQANSGNTKVFYLRYAKAKDVIETLNGIGKNLVKGESSSSSGSINTNKLNIYADEATNAIIVYADPTYIKEIDTIIKKLDIRRAQVLVEAIIVEMSDSNAAQLGIQWGNIKGGIVQGPSSVSQVQVSDMFRSDPPSITNVAGSIEGAGIGFYHGNWFGLLTMMRSDNKSDVLSTPSIITLDNQEAEFNIGQEVPVKTGTQTSTSSETRYDTIERKTVGTKLKFVPQINEGDSVLLTLEQEVSSVEASSKGSANGETFNVRTIKNSVLVKSGETVVLGGLIDHKTEETVSKVPILGDIPLLGELFKQTTSTSSKRNLMVFIRPIILRDDESYAGISTAKYSMFRNEQLQRHEEGLRLLPMRLSTPVMPELDSTIVISPNVIQVIKAQDDVE